MVFKATYEVLGPEWGVPLLLGWILWEFHAPRLLGVDTAIAPLLELPDRVEHVEQRTDEIATRVEEMDETQANHVQVTRANSRAIDEESDVSVDPEEVDEYLVERGVPIVKLTEEA